MHLSSTQQLNPIASTQKSEHRKDAHQCAVDSSLYMKQGKYLSYTHGAAAALLAPYLPTPSISLTANKCQPE